MEKFNAARLTADQASFNVATSFLDSTLNDPDESGPFKAPEVALLSMLLSLTTWH